MSLYQSIDRLQWENKNLREGIRQLEEAYEILQTKFAEMKKENGRLGSTIRAMVEFGSLPKPVLSGLRSPPPEQEREIVNVAGQKREWAEDWEEKKWQRVGSPEPKMREEKEEEREPDSEEKESEVVRLKKEEDICLPVMVKIGGVRWSDGIRGVLEGLQGTGIVNCDGSRWLVGKEEREGRRKSGSKSSTVLLKVKGAEAAGKLCRSGLWVGGYWCSVRRYVAIPPRRKDRGWVERFGDLSGRLEGLRKSLVRLEGKEVFQSQEWRKEKMVGEEVMERVVKKGSNWMADADLEELFQLEEEAVRRDKEAEALVGRKGKRARRKR